MIVVPLNCHRKKELPMLNFRILLISKKWAASIGFPMVFVSLTFQYLKWKQTSFLACIHQDCTERRPLYTFWAFFYEVLWITDVMLGYHGDEIFVCCSALQICLHRFCPLRPYSCFSACRMVMTQNPLISIAFVLVYWHVWVHPEAVSKCCQLYIYWWVMLPIISLCNVVTTNLPSEKDLISWVLNWHGFLLFHMGWVLKFLHGCPISYLFISRWRVSEKTIFELISLRCIASQQLHFDLLWSN